jgi:hypothetical protein
VDWESDFVAAKFHLVQLTRERRQLLLFSSLLVVIVCAVVITALVAFKSSQIVLPNPNGYDDLLEAGQLVVIDSDALTNTNHEVLIQLRMLLTSGFDGMQPFISWAPEATNYFLEMSPSLNGGSWSRVSNGIASSATGFVYTNGFPVQGSVFFRLHAY